MTRTRWLKVKQLYYSALEEPEATRTQFVLTSAGEDEPLGQEVVRLLAERGRDDGFLSLPAAQAATSMSDGPNKARAVTDTADESRGERPGDRIGRYTLTSLLGEGGFADVWLAEQQEPVRRQVALKLLKPGLESRAVIARFEAERQALAIMDHPGVAQVFDAGATESGRPYFVMELVRGEPLTRYCEARQIAIHARLELFAQVCDAVQHAHQKGVIHRDLKPSNLLVEEVDGRPLPKVIDFGIAKAIAGGEFTQEMVTERGLFVGTPAYMSPEQAGAAPRDVDTRSDVYSLGVVLYELLTGSLPLDASTLQSGGKLELARMIREIEPLRPSSRAAQVEKWERARVGTRTPERSLVAQAGSAPPLSGAAEDTPSHLPTFPPSHARDARALARRLRGDLDAITLKALEKDRERRYASAAELAADIRRHLRGETVIAAEPGVLYRTRKFVRRNRVGVIAGCVVLASLLTGLTTTTWMYFEAASQRELAKGEAQRAGAAEHRANTRLLRATEAIQIMHEFAEHELANLAGGTRPRLVLAERALRDRKQLAEDEEAERATRHTLAYAYQRVGEVKLVMGRVREALASHEASLRIRSENVQRASQRADSLRSLAVGHWKLFEVRLAMGQSTAALEHAEQSVAVLARLAVLPADDPGADGTPAEGWGSYFAIGYRRVGDACVQLGDDLRAANEYRRSILAYGEVPATGLPQPAILHRGHAQSCRSLAEALTRAGCAPEAVAWCDRADAALEAAEQITGPANVLERSERARTLLARATAVRSLGDVQSAITATARAVEIALELSSLDPLNAESALLLGCALREQGRTLALNGEPEAARSVAESAVETLERTAAIDEEFVIARLETARACAVLAEVLFSAARAEAAGARRDALDRGAENARTRAREICRSLLNDGRMEHPAGALMREIEAAPNTPRP